MNLAVALVIFLAGFGVTVFAGSLGGQAASVFLGLGVLVTFVSWFQMRLEENERAGKTGDGRTGPQPRRLAV